MYGSSLRDVIRTGLINPDSRDIYFIFFMITPWAVRGGGEALSVLKKIGFFIQGVHWIWKIFRVDHRNQGGGVICAENIYPFLTVVWVYTRRTPRPTARLGNSFCPSSPITTDSRQSYGFFLKGRIQFSLMDLIQSEHLDYRIRGLNPSKRCTNIYF